MSMRTHARQMAHTQMEFEGCSNVNRDIKGEHIGPSFFSKNWRTYAVTPKAVKKACTKERSKQAEKRIIRNNNRAKLRA